MLTLVVGYTNIALEGDSINFSCSSGLELTGPNSSTCMGNGEWEPDPREVACEGGNESLTSKINNSQLHQILILSVPIQLL